MAASQSLANYRQEYVAFAAACIRRIDCATFYVEGSFVPCWEDAGEDAKPSAGVRAFCEPWCSRWFECGYTCEVSACEEGWWFLTDPYLERMLECTDVPCEELEACQSRLEDQL